MILGALLSCLVSGDSIALGLGQALAGRCSVDAKIGIGSAAIVSRVRTAGLVVISAGSNDPRNPRLVENLEAARQRAGAARVLWIVPTDPIAATAVRTVSGRHGDLLAVFTPAPDGEHPRSYTSLRDTVLSALKE